MSTSAFDADAVVVSAETVHAPGHVVWRDGKVLAAGEGPAPREVAARRLPPGVVIAPGFVNAHAHLAFGEHPHLAHDHAFLDWIHEGVLPAVGAAAEDAEAWRRGALRSCRELLAGGVTFVADSFLAVDGWHALQETGLGGRFHQEVFGSLAPEDAGYIAEWGPKLDALSQELGTTDFGYAPHTPWTCPAEVLRWIIARAREEGRPLTLHLDESPEEAAFFRTQSGRLHEAIARRGILDRYRLGASPTRMLEDMGLLGPDLLLVHGVQLEAADIALIAERGAGLVHCPVSNAKLAVGAAPIAELLAAGVRVGLGTDSAASAGRLDMFEEMRAFLLGQRARTRSTTGLHARVAFDMATAVGADLLGEGRRRGRLLPGLAADLQLTRVVPPTGGKAFGWIDALVWTGVKESVLATIVGGEVRHGAGTLA